MRVYICGPNPPHKSYDPFQYSDAVSKLEKLGHTPILPPALSMAPKRNSEYFRINAPMLVQCDGMALLPGWSGLDMCKVERRMAVVARMYVRPIDEWVGGETADAAIQVRHNRGR